MKGFVLFRSQQLSVFLYGRAAISIFYFDNEHGVNPPDCQIKKTQILRGCFGRLQSVVQQIPQNGCQVHAADIGILGIFDIRDGNRSDGADDRVGNDYVPSVGKCHGMYSGGLLHWKLYGIIITSRWGDVWQFPAKALAVILVVMAISAAAAVWSPARKIRNMSVAETIGEL